jgi:hypothetical protein
MVGKQWLGSNGWEAMVGKQWLGSNGWEAMVGKQHPNAEAEAEAGAGAGYSRGVSERADIQQMRSLFHGPSMILGLVVHVKPYIAGAAAAADAHQEIIAAISSTSSTLLGPQLFCNMSNLAGSIYAAGRG